MSLSKILVMCLYWDYDDYDRARFGTFEFIIMIAEPYLSGTVPKYTMRFYVGFVDRICFGVNFDGSCITNYQYYLKYYIANTVYQILYRKYCISNILILLLLLLVFIYLFCQLLNSKDNKLHVELAHKNVLALHSKYSEFVVEQPKLYIHVGLRGISVDS